MQRRRPAEVVRPPIGHFENSAITYDHKASSGNKWNVPVGIGFAKTIRVGGKPVKFQFGVEYSVVSQDDFGKRAH